MRRIACILLPVLLFLLPGQVLRAQFRSEAFSQSYNSDPSDPNDTTDKLFSLKEYFGGLAHQNELKIGTMFGGSMIFVGGCQIYNKDYWKLPIFYGGIAAGIYGGIHFNKLYQGQMEADPLSTDTRNKTLSTLCFAGAGLAYWASLMDGTISYKPRYYPHPGRATIYSILVPGLGQAYNHEFWKVPIYIGGMIGSVHFYLNNKTNYERYRRIYLEATTSDHYTGPIPAETALYYRDVYRRYRDYSVLALFAFYLLQVIDANVFSYMHGFEMSDDLSLKVSPTVIAPDTQFAFAPPTTHAVGLSVGFRF